MLEKYTDLGHFKGLLVWENTSSSLFLLNENVILHSLPLWITIWFSSHQQDLVRKLLYLAVASLSNSEKQKPLFRNGLESSWQGGQGVREMELSPYTGYLS